MPTITKVYSMQEAAKHNTRGDCWVIIDGKIYNVTEYLDEHPGGDNVLLSATGRDSTEEFEEAGHGADARKLMHDYFIGEIGSPIIIPELEIFVKEQPSNFGNKILKENMQYWALPAAVVGISIAVGLLYARKR